VELLDIDTLELSKDSFVDKELSEYFPDLLYKVGCANLKLIRERGLC
jgi:predicted transposase YdaD